MVLKMELIYTTIVKEIGEKAGEFFEQGMFIIFKDDAPDYLKQYCVVHSGNQLLQKVEPGDEFFIDDTEFGILAVGEVVNENLQDLGHITIRFDGDTSMILPGTICLEKKELPEIKAESRFEIKRKMNGAKIATAQNAAKGN